LNRNGNKTVDRRREISQKKQKKEGRKKIDRSKKAVHSLELIQEVLPSMDLTAVFSLSGREIPENGMAMQPIRRGKEGQGEKKEKVVEQRGQRIVPITLRAFLLGDRCEREEARRQWPGPPPPTKKNKTPGRGGT